MEHFQTDRDTRGPAENGEIKYSTVRDIKGGLMPTS